MEIISYFNGAHFFFFKDTNPAYKRQCLSKSPCVPTVACMKRWGLRTSYLSAGTNADAGQKHSYNHLNPNVLYMMLALVFIVNRFYFYSSCVNQLKIFPNIKFIMSNLCQFQRIKKLSKILVE